MLNLTYKKTLSLGRGKGEGERQSESERELGREGGRERDGWR